MDSLGRLLLRVVLVPLGYFVAVIIGTLVIVFGSWKLGVVRRPIPTRSRSRCSASCSPRRSSWSCCSV